MIYHNRTDVVKLLMLVRQVSLRSVFFVTIDIDVF